MSLSCSDGRPGRPGARVAEAFPWRITLCREQRPAEAGPRRRGPHRRLRSRLVVLTGVAALGIGVAAGPALAGSPNGSTTATISVAVRSITVSPGTTTFDLCVVFNSGASTGSTLSFPNGHCVTANTGDRITITNGPVPGHIDVQGSDAIPSDGGTHWTLCGGTGSVACTGAVSAGQTFPGQDQFDMITETSGGLDAGPFLANSPQCDGAFAGTSAGGSCVAAASQASTEVLALDGPSLSSDTSPTFTTVVTWTALP